MNIVYFNDLVKYLMAARQNVLVISSATLFEKENLQLKVINGNIKLVESDEILLLRTIASRGVQQLKGQFIWKVSILP